MALAMVSAFTGIPVRKDVAMTGEITLRGRVLPIGGLKSKILAAHLSGAGAVILPLKNQKDLIDIPQEIRKQIKLVLVESMDQVLEHALRARAQAPGGQAGRCGRARARRSTRSRRRHPTRCAAASRAPTSRRRSPRRRQLRDDQVR